MMREKTFIGSNVEGHGVFAAEGGKQGDLPSKFTEWKRRVYMVSGTRL